MPQEDHRGGQLNHPEEIFWFAFPAYDDATVVVQPGEQALDLPTTAVTSKGSTILGKRSGTCGVVGRDHLHAVVASQSLIEWVAVVGAIPDQPRGEIGEESSLEGGFDELGFMRRSTGHVQGERKTMAVANRHDFAALTASSRANGGAPFFAELKVASMKASLRSSLPRSRKSSASFSRSRSSNFERCHCWKRRWQV